MKILTLNANLRGVGTYLRCFYFSRELARAGHDVTMVTVSRESRFKSRRYYKWAWTGEGERPEPNHPCVRMVEGPQLGYKGLPGWGSGPLDIVLRIREILRERFEAVYGFEYQPNVSWPVYSTQGWAGFQFFSDWCDWYAGGSNRYRGYRWAHRLDGWLEEHIRFRAKKVTVISEMLGERARRIGIPAEQVVLVPEGIDTDYVTGGCPFEARQRLRLPERNPMVLAMNDDDMGRTIRILADSFKANPELRALLLGNVPPAAKSLAEKLGIGSKIIWCGWVSDVDYPVYLAAANVCILPLTCDQNNAARFPAKVLDFLASGRPVVMTNVGEAASLVANHRIGVAVDGDESEFAGSVNRIVADPVTAELMGERGRQLMIREWEWRTRTQLLESIVA